MRPLGVIAILAVAAAMLALGGCSGSSGTTGQVVPDDESQKVLQEKMKDFMAKKKADAQGQQKK